jgi:hypothetical protein
MATKKDEVERVRRITVREVLGGTGPDKDDVLLGHLLKNKTETVQLAQVYGIAKAGRVKVTDVGESIAFIGDFKARSLYGETKGQVYAASKCFLPKFLEEELYGLLGPANADGVTFAFELGVKYDKESVTKYIYTARPLIAAQTSGPLALLEAQISGKALPAPKAA